MIRPKKRRFFVTISFVLLVTLVIVGVAFALASGQPQKDTFVNTRYPDTNYSTDGNLWAITTGDSSGNCYTIDVIYMEWSLTDITNPNDIASATLTLDTTYASSGGFGYYGVALYESADAADLNAITWNTQPARGSLIEAKSFPATNDLVVFSSTALVNYIKSQASGDDVLTLAIKLDPLGPCPSGDRAVVFYSNETIDGTPANLQIRDPNAVSLSVSSVKRSNPTNWPLIASLAVLMALITAGISYGVHRWTS